MRLYWKKLVNCISFDSQLNVEFNAVKIKNIPLNRYCIKTILHSVLSFLLSN